MSRGHLQHPAVRHATVAALCVALGVGASACYIETDTESPRRVREVEPTVPAPSPPVRPGKVVVKFTIGGSTDPNECAKSAVKELEVTLTNARGEAEGTWRHQCEAFAVALTLTPGTYAGSAVLLDRLQNPRTTRVTIDGFTVRGNETIEVPVNFPASSFLQ